MHDSKMQNTTSTVIPENYISKGNIESKVNLSSLGNTVNTKSDDRSFNNRSSKDVKYFVLSCTDCNIDIPNVLGLSYSEVFIHKNMGNIIEEKDANFNFALKYAIENHKIRHFLSKFGSLDNCFPIFFK